MEAVRLRLDGHTVAKVAQLTGLSAPTVSAAWKAFREGGWEAVPVRQRGRKAGQSERLDEAAQEVLIALLASQPEMPDPAWSSRMLANALANEGLRVSPRTIEHWLEARDLKPEPLALDALSRKRSHAGRWVRQQVQPVLEQTREARGAIWQGGSRAARPAKSAEMAPRRYQLYLHGKRGALYSRVLVTPPLVDDYLALFQRLLDRADGKPVALIFRGADLQAAPEIGEWLTHHPAMQLMTVPTPASPGDVSFPKRT